LPKKYKKLFAKKSFDKTFVHCFCWVYNAPHLKIWIWFFYFFQAITFFKNFKIVSYLLYKSLYKISPKHERNSRHKFIKMQGRKFIWKKGRQKVEITKFGSIYINLHNSPNEFCYLAKRFVICYLSSPIFRLSQHN
jgi:hypothetical protein